MSKSISIKQYDKAQELFMKTTFSMSNIARLCEIPKSTMSLYFKKWEERGLKRPVDKSNKKVIDKILHED